MREEEHSVSGRPEQNEFLLPQNPVSIKHAWVWWQEVTCGTQGEKLPKRRTDRNRKEGFSRTLSVFIRKKDAELPAKHILHGIKVAWETRTQWSEPANWSAVSLILSWNAMKTFGYSCRITHNKRWFEEGSVWMIVKIMK